MSFKPPRRWTRLALLAVVACGTSLCLAQAVEEVWVKRREIPIREGKGGAYEPVANATRGQKLQVIERDDRWLKVKLLDPAVEGYVLEDAISTTEVRASSGGGARAVVLAEGPQSSDITISAAGKGLEDQAETYAQQKGMDPKVVDKMIERRLAITGAEWEAFANEVKAADGKSPQATVE